MRSWKDYFYTSREWKRCRFSYVRSKFGLCERCGGSANQVHHKTYLTRANINDPNVSLNHDNLELLCYVCHQNEHFRKSTVANGLVFDENGDLVTVSH